MRKLVVSCLLLVVCCSVYAQLADQLPDTLSKKKIVGTFISQSSTNALSSFSKIKIKRNHTYSWRSKNNSPKEVMARTSDGKWRILKDTLFFESSNPLNPPIKFVMHNGLLHRIKKDGSSDPAALMTKKDYKFYQRQCRQSGK